MSTIVKMPADVRALIVRSLAAALVATYRRQQVERDEEKHTDDSAQQAANS